MAINHYLKAAKKGRDARQREVIVQEAAAREARKLADAGKHDYLNKQQATATAKALSDQLEAKSRLENQKLAQAKTASNIAQDRYVALVASLLAKAEATFTPKPVAKNAHVHRPNNSPVPAHSGRTQVSEQTIEKTLDVKMILTSDAELKK